MLAGFAVVLSKNEGPRRDRSGHSRKARIVFGGTFSASFQFDLYARFTGQSNRNDTVFFGERSLPRRKAPIVLRFDGLYIRFLETIFFPFSSPSIGSFNSRTYFCVL